MASLVVIVAELVKALAARVQARGARELDAPEILGIASSIQGLTHEIRSLIGRVDRLLEGAAGTRPMLEELIARARRND